MAAAASTAPPPHTRCHVRSGPGPTRSVSARPHTPPRPDRAGPATSTAPPPAVDTAAPGTPHPCRRRCRRPPPTARAHPDRHSYALVPPGPPANVGTTGQAHPDRQPTTTCERGPGPNNQAPPYRLIHQVSRGLRRAAVNNLAIQALVAAYTADKAIVDESSARAAVAEVTADWPAPRRDHHEAPPAEPAGLLLVRVGKAPARLRDCGGRCDHCEVCDLLPRTAIPRI